MAPGHFGLAEGARRGDEGTAAGGGRRGRGGAGRAMAGGLGEPAAAFGAFFGGAAPRPFLRPSGPEGSLWARDPAGRVDAPQVNAPLLAWAARAPPSRGGFGAPRAAGIVEGDRAGVQPRKRAPSSYFLFLADAREAILRERPSLRGSAAGVAREAAARWKALGADERAEYTRRAAEGRAAQKAREEAFRARVSATKRRAADAELEGLEAAAGRAQKKGKKAAAKSKKRAAAPATPERAPKRKASSARATAAPKAAKAPKAHKAAKAAKAGRGGGKKKAATKQLSALVAVAGAVNRAGNGKSDGAAATRRSSRRGSA